MAYRSLSRPSSAPDAKAFPLRSFQLDLSWSAYSCSQNYAGVTEVSHCSYPFQNIHNLRLRSLSRTRPLLPCFLTHFTLFSFQGAEKEDTSARGFCRSCVPSKLNNVRSLKRSDLGIYAKPLVSRGLLRKEVIQPHLPIRLPCYDFTPITKPTFGRALPCGLDYGLRVFPALMV